VFKLARNINSFEQNMKKKGKEDVLSPFIQLKNSRITHYMLEVVKLSAGASFGENALLTKEPRAARIVTLTHCKFAVLTKFYYDRVLGRKEKQQKLETINFLQNIPIFQPYSKSKIH